MRLKITHLKAPWPLGAVVGDVIDLPVMPAWAAGKCVRVGDDVELTIVHVEVVADDVPVFVVNPEVTGDGAGESLPEVALDEAIQSQDAKPLADAGQQKGKGKK